jgi:hypothetical protein
MGDARTVFLLEKIGETFGVSPDELRTDMDGLGARSGRSSSRTVLPN